ncbi:efflux transporter outer membrane subunit [Rohdeia mirabilis]|uniref:efflux transporter outer membrane subunit n=1 Tax=Rohdeia mirabilis TaxID=2528008 RepID=UPI003AF3AD84
MRWRALAVVWSLACVASCHSAKPLAPERYTPNLPDAFVGSTTGADSASPVAWWREFEDERIDALVLEALSNNRSLRAASSRMDAAAAVARDAAGAGRPRLDASLDGARSRQNIIGVIPGNPLFTNYATSFGLTATVSWELDLWGRIAADRSAARNRFAATEWDLEGAAQSIAARAVKAWIAIVEATQQTEIAALAVRNRETWQSSIEQRFDSGGIAALDVELARTEAARARADLAVARGAESEARRALELLLGRYPEGTYAAARTLPRVPADVPGGLPAELLDRRPDLRAARERLMAAHQDTRSARASLYPRLSLTASGGTRSNELADLLDGDFRVWSLAGNVLAPIFDNGRLRARVDARESEFAAAEQEFTDLVLRACAEIERLLEAERLLATRESELALAEASATRAEQGALDRYGRGQTDIATLLLAQRTALATRSERVRVRRLRLESRIDLHLALGGTLAGARRATDVARPKVQPPTPLERPKSDAAWTDMPEPSDVKGSNQ